MACTSTPGLQQAAAEAGVGCPLLLQAPVASWALRLNLFCHSPAKAELLSHLKMLPVHAEEFSKNGQFGCLFSAFCASGDAE